VTLGWIRGHPAKWTTFVANRVAERHRTVAYGQWHHVPGRNNPADCASVSERVVVPRAMVVRIGFPSSGSFPVVVGSWSACVSGSPGAANQSMPGCLDNAGAANQSMPDCLDNTNANAIFVTATSALCYSLDVAMAGLPRFRAS